MPAEKFINDIRKFEAKEKLKPSTINVLATGQVSVTIDKSVLYEYEPGLKTRSEELWNWLNDSDNNFSPEMHGARLQAALNKDQPNDEIEVTVRRRYKQLPIPYFSIPIPIENAGTKVRDFNNLATQKIKVTVVFPKDYDSHLAIEQLLKASMISDNCDDDKHIPAAARRHSWNPIKWLLHILSKLIPHRVAQKIYQKLPTNLLNIWIKATRPYEWGTNFCAATLDEGFINSGALASLGNLVLTPLTIPALHVLTDYDELIDSPNCIERSNRRYPDEGFTTNRWSFYLQSRTKIAWDRHIEDPSEEVTAAMYIAAEDKSSDEMISMAITRTFS